MRFTIVVELAPVEYGQAFGLATVAEAKQHAQQHLPRAIVKELGTWPGINPRVTEVLEDPR